MRRIALVTGGSRGIGAAVVRTLAADGCSVVFCYVRAEETALALERTLRGEGLDVRAVRCDVGDPAAVRAMTAEILRTWRHIDILVNNAGVAWRGLLPEMTDGEWRALFAADVDGVFHCCREVLPGMISRGQGSIVNIASVWGEVGASCEAAYSAAKAAVIGLTRALAKEAGPSGVRVNCVSPGVIATEMNAALDEAAMAALREETPLGRIGTPEEVAAAVRFLAGEESAFITGQVLGVNGGFGL